MKKLLLILTINSLLIFNSNYLNKETTLETEIKNLPVFKKLESIYNRYVEDYENYEKTIKSLDSNKEYEIAKEYIDPKEYNKKIEKSKYEFAKFKGDTSYQIEHPGPEQYKERIEKAKNEEQKRIEDIYNQNKYSLYATDMRPKERKKQQEVLTLTKEEQELLKTPLTEEEEIQLENLIKEKKDETLNYLYKTKKKHTNFLKQQDEMKSETNITDEKKRTEYRKKNYEKWYGPELTIKQLKQKEKELKEADLKNEEASLKKYNEYKDKKDLIKAKEEEEKYNKLKTNNSKKWEHGFTHELLEELEERKFKDKQEKEEIYNKKEEKQKIIKQKPEESKTTKKKSDDYNKYTSEDQSIKEKKQYDRKW